MRALPTDIPVFAVIGIACFVLFALLRIAERRQSKNMPAQRRTPESAEVLEFMQQLSAGLGMVLLITQVVEWVFPGL